MQQRAKRFVACPTCSKQLLWGPESPFRPFCSERCKLIDLGQWASEQFRIPVEGDADPLDGDADQSRT